MGAGINPCPKKIEGFDVIVREELNRIISGGGFVKHKALSEETQMLPNDWIRIYKSKDHGCIDELIWTCDYQEYDKIPQEFLDMEFDHIDTWLVGGYLALDFVIDIK